MTFSNLPSLQTDTKAAVLIQFGGPRHMTA